MSLYLQTQRLQKMNFYAHKHFQTCYGPVKLRRLSLLSALALLVVGCVHYPEERRSASTFSIPASSSATLSVMTYNLEGLPWPARKGRGLFLREITAEFQRMEQRGVLPDVIVFQEAFSSQALQAAASTPHPFFTSGPRATRRSELPKSRDPIPRKSNYLRGEWGVRFMVSGLAIASRYPIIEEHRQPYGPSSCAGWDCLAKKSVMLVQVAVPGVPDPIEIATTHMNSQGASGVKPEKHLAAHMAQSAELAL